MADSKTGAGNTQMSLEDLEVPEGKNMLKQTNKQTK